MKLHLPVFLRKAILSLMLAYGVPAVQAADLTLGAGDSLSVDYSASGSLLDLNNGTLQLSGGTLLALLNSGEGDGKTYTLLSGVSGLLDAQGNAISLDDTNNAASLYFDASQPGTGFWANGTLQLNHGTLQLVLHNETVKEAITITSRQTNPSAYQYYAGIAFEDISNVSDSYAYGGAIYGGTNTLSNNGSVSFSENTASGRYAYGGVIYGGTITLSDNGSVTFSGNKASGSTSAYGGAIYGDVTMTGNGDVSFSGNTASSSYYSAYGGAIYGGTITLSNNGSVSFSGNTASTDSYTYGGAIYGDRGSTITLSDIGSVVFEGNTASSSSSSAYGACGGAIYGDYYSTITLSDNGSVSFSGNTASASSSACGGAIYTEGDLSIRNNGSVLFEKNMEKSGSSYRLRSIYVYGGSGDELSLSAAAGKSITFRDSIYIGSGSFKLNEAFEGKVQQGDIIFTGATTEADLYTVKGNEAGTAEEIRLSRTSEVNTLTELYGGRLRVEEGAIYQGQGITAMEDSAATVRVQNATLKHSGYDLTFNAGTTLELAGNSTIAGAVQMLGSSSLVFDNTDGNGATDIIGSLGLGADVSLALGNQAYGSNEVLLYVSDAVSGWDAANLTVQGNSYTTDSFTWVDNLLVLNYDESRFNSYFNGSVNYNERLVGYVIRHHYESVAFTVETSSPQGGAIYCGEDGVISLSNNGSVTFCGNTASSSYSSAYGGAIYGYDGSTITLSDNGSVVFEGNKASGSTSAYGGAIYGYDGSTITLSDNGSVVFEGNTASSSYYSAKGGAIDGDVTMTGNGDVSFSGNTASSSDADAYGGAIYGSVTMEGNGDVSFSGNTASSSYSFAYGGAIYGGVTMEGNGDVSFSGNKASGRFASGGAIYGNEYSTITLSDNGIVSFSGNTASSSDSYANGGAIYGNPSSNITLSDNGSVVFEGNTASASSFYSSAYGGAIYTYNNLSIRNNDSVEFYKNAEVGGNTYRLRSIYAYGGSGDEISLSAAAGKSITFRDSIYIGNYYSNSSFKLNEAYEGKAQLGDIIFTGATTVDDLYTVKGNVAGTAGEIRLSRTSEVNTLTELYGGRLRVEEGAIYQGRGISAMEGSAATVRVQNATLIHEGYDLTFNADTTLELTGANTITGNVQMLEGSALVFDLTQYQGTTIHSGSWSVADGALVSVALDSSGWTGEWGEVKTIVLLKTDAEHSASQFDSSISPLTGNWGCSGLQWVDGTLSIAFKNGATNAEWTNAAGDFRWNNESSNWTDSGCSFARVNGADVTFGKSAEGSILLDGQMEVGKMTVSADAVYALDFATGASLTVQKDLVLEIGAALTLHGNLDAAAVKAKGALVVDGNVDMNGALNLCSGSAITGHVSGATDATLSNATITGALDASGEVSTDGGSIGSITGTATKVELTDMDSIGCITMATAGDLVVSDTETGAVNAANGNTVANATLTNATIGSGLDVTYNMTTTGDVTVAGDVTVGKDLAVNTGTLNAANVTVDGTTTLTNGKVDVEGTFHSTTVILNNIDGEMAELKADKGLSLSGSDLDVTITGTGAEAVKVAEGGMSLAAGATVTNEGGASIAGGLTVDDATFTNKGGVAVTGKTEVTNGGELTGASLTTDGLSVTNDAEVTAKGITNAGAVVVKDGGKLTADSVSGATSAELTDASIAGVLAMTGTDADVTAAGGSIGSITGADDVTLENQAEVGSITMSGNLEMTNVSAASVSGATSATLSNATIAGELNSSGEVSAASSSIGSITGTATKVELTDMDSIGSITMATTGDLVVSGTETGAVNAANGNTVANATLSNATIGSSLNVTNDLAAAGQVHALGIMTVGGKLTGTGLFDLAGALSVRELKATSLVSSGAVELTGTNVSHAVTGDMEVDSVSLAAGSSLAVGGVLTTDEVQMSGTALTLTAGSFGASTMNFELDRAALESLGLAHGATAVIARTTASLTEEVAVMLNGTTDFVQAAAYEYKISAVGNTVQVLADYAHEGMKVWYRGAWVGVSSWADYHIAGYDAVDGVENVNLCNRSYSGDMLIVALEQGVHSAVITGAELEFANVDLGGGELVLGAGTTLTSTEIYGSGETLSVLENAALHADAVQLGVLHLEYTDVSLKDASIGAITGTTGKLTIARNGKVTVNSDVELGSFLNDGYLNVGSHNLTVNALTDKGGNVTAAEVSVQCRASRMAEFDMLIADRVTVTNNVAGARYSDDIVLGDGSVVGELLADKLVVKGGTVTLGSTTAETVQNVHALELQNGATLILNQTFVELGEDFVASDGSSIQLEEGGNVLRGDLGVSSLEEALVLDATTLTGDELPSTLSNARMTAYGDDAARYDGLLLDSAVVNEGSGTFSVNNSGNALVEIEACRGDVLVYNVPTHALRKLDIADGKTVSAYSAGTAHAAYEASVVLNGTARIGRSARLNANLVVKSGSSLNLAGSLTMGSSLELESGLTLGGVVFSSLQFAQSGAVIGLFNGVDELTLAGQKYNAISLSDGVLASVVFSNLENNGAHEYYFVYDSATQGEGELGICYNYNDNYVTPDEPEIPDTPVTPDEPEIPDTPVTPDEPEIPDTPVTPDEPEIPDTPVTPEEPEIPEPLKPFRPGDSALVSSEIDKNMEVILNGKGTLTLEGKVNAGAITVNCDKNITFKSTKKKPGSLTGDGDLTKKGKGTLTLNDGNSSWTGDTHLLAGTIKVKGTTSLGKGDVYVKGGTLHLGSKAIGNDIIQSKDAAIKSGKKFTGTYTLESGDLLKGSTLNISKTATLEGGSVNGTLTGTGSTTVTGKVKLGDKGKITTKALTLGADATLTTSAKGLSSKTTTLTIGEDAILSLGGKMTVDSVKMNGGTLKTTASKPAAMTVKNDMELTDAVLTTNGKVTTNKLTLNDSTMSIKGAKAQNLTVKQNLTIGSGSALTLNGKLSAGSLTIKKDGMLTMTGSKPVTLKVKGALTLNEGSSIILNYSFVQGKTYKVLTFGSYSGSKDYYSIFGVEEDDCTITNTGKALTLTVNTKWKPQTQQKAVSAGATEPVVATKPLANPVADALVQANWGQLEASRAFVNAMANRSMAVQLGNGERAVWASAIGSSSRHDTAGGHNGADTNVSGGAFGLETQVGRASLFGMALGNSWTRVSAHGFGTIEQDTTHLGLYGQTNWRSGISADWSAAYGRSESESMGSDWNQKHLQLDGRVSYNHELNARTQLSPFAGVQYYASDSAGIGTTDAGSLQNLRAEIGVGASYRTGKLGVFGEIALHQDMARNNPTVSMEGVRSTGMNPGRTGINFTIGASYELSDKWSVNASYTGEFVENANAHSANIGASYKF